MTKTKSTKRALLLSALSLLMCVSMLVGSTFAWFTDSVTSAGNKIVAGTLDVDLLKGTAADTYTSIAGMDAAIFGTDIIWEPGKTQIVYLAVANEGNLDLKYNIALNVVDGGLIGSLEYAIVDGAKYGEISETSWTALKARSDAQTGDVVAGTTVAAPNGAITVTEKTEYFALAVHMKEEAGNKYQGKDITIDVTVLATQLASESDSFNNQYDANAEMPGRAATAEEKSALEYLLQTANDGETIYLDAIDYGAIYVGAGYGVTDLPENLTIVGDPSSRMSITIGNNFAVKGWTFRNITFTGTGLFITNGADAQNVTVDSCIFVRSADLYFKKATGDVTITNSNFYDNGTTKGIYIQTGTNVTVDRCTFRNHKNAVNISASGNIVVSNNNVNGTIDRPLRFVSSSSSATIKVTGNTIVSNGNAAGELMKAEYVVTDANITLSGNTWNGKSDSEMTVGMVGSDYIVK